MTDCIYQEKKEEEDSPTLIQGLENYMKKTKRLIKAVNNSIGIIKEPYGYFKRQTNQIARKTTPTWLRKENLKRN